MIMTNYYEELKLDKNLSLNELRENLIRLESIWTDRASNLSLKHISEPTRLLSI